MALLLAQLWCWSHANGSALVRMALVKDALQQRKIDQRYLRVGHCPVGVGVANENHKLPTGRVRAGEEARV